MGKTDIGILDPEGKNNNPLTNEPYSETYKNLGKIWSGFSAYDNAKKIIKDIIKYNVLLVISGTGSGKTVLLPKYMLHALNYKGKIAVTLPKTMVAKSAAEFSANTLDVELGTHVGYQYRNSGKNTHSSDTKLLYCTDGTLVARLLSDPELKDFDAVIIDEAHERKINIDFLLFLLRYVLSKRPDFKLIIMSATIDESLFRDYYNDYNYKYIEIGVKTNYPIKSIFLKENLNINNQEYLSEGKKIIQNLLKTTTDGGILLFVTSVAETNSICDMLSDEDSEFKDRDICIPVYSNMDAEQEKLATDADYYRGFVKNGRKIIVATNVAESSLTIKGITYVIDAGLELSSRYNPVSRINILEKIYITHAQAKQRMGRTGRTGPGTCYHLYTKHTFDELMERFPQPSIKTESINYEIIRLLNLPKINNIKILRDTFDKFIQPPSIKYINAELSFLKELELLSSTGSSGELTELGRMVSSLQTEPSEALTLIMAYKLYCFREVAAILAVIDASKCSISKLFTISLSSDSKNKNLIKKFKRVIQDFDNKYGDHIAILKIFRGYEKKRQDKDKIREWCYKYFLKRDTLEDAYKTYMRMKRRYWNILLKLKPSEVDKKLIEEDLIYRILASFVYGHKLNILEKAYDRILTLDKQNVSIDKDSFLKKNDTKNSPMIYTQLFQGNSKRVSAKIVSKIPKKSIKILERVM
jgi:pre-mRNA-splicing factor ATP-dependent RNA helicase DHX15/PRP43